MCPEHAAIQRVRELGITVMDNGIGRFLKGGRLRQLVLRVLEALTADERGASIATVVDTGNLD